MQTNNDNFRLFISSTFKDMDKERSYLVEWIFPRIKELCAERGVEFFPIDLRWGITEEDGKDGKIINACFEEIDNSRPFFIGLLGDRYGWQPTVANLGKDAPALLERYPWLLKDIKNGLSITEMEMQYGVLRQKEIDAAFYIRNEEQDSSVDRLMSQEYKHLERLKKSIRCNPNICSHNYESVEELGELVFQDLKAVVEREFPADKETQKRYTHERSFRSHLTNYVNLSKYHNQIDEALCGLSKEHKFLVLHGIKGAGKSTALCTFIEQYRKTHESSKILYYDIAKVSFDSTVEWKTDERLGQWISRVPFAWGMIRFLWTIDHELVHSKARERFLVLDNLEYLPPDQHEKFVDFLSKYDFSKSPKIIVTHTDYEFNPYHTSEDDETFSYISVDKLQAEKVEITGIRHEDIPIFVDCYLKRFGKALTPQQLAQFTHPIYAENPHYLIMALHQLVEFSSFEKIQDEIDYLTDEFDYQRGWNQERNILNTIRSISIPVTYTLDNVIGREVGEWGEPNTLAKVFWILFVLGRVGRGFTEREIIEIFSFTPAQWALFRPQVMLICRIHNGMIVLNDVMFNYILGHVGNVEDSYNAVIQHFEPFPWLHQLEEEWKKKGKSTLSSDDKARVEECTRKAEVLPIFLFFARRHDVLRAYFANPKIRKNIPSDDVRWLEKRLQEKLNTTK